MITEQLYVAYFQIVFVVVVVVVVDVVVVVVVFVGSGRFKVYRCLYQRMPG